MERKYVRFDWAMKHILRDKANFGILEGFLAELLKEDVKIVEVLESESNARFEDDKYNRVDILVKNSKDELVIVEVQTQADIQYFLRILYGVSKTLTEFLKKGDEYKMVKKIISISIVYIDMGQGSDYVYKGETEFIGLHTQEKLKLTNAQIRFFQKGTPAELFPTYYIINVNKFISEPKDGLDQWIYFFKNSEIRSDFNAKGLSEAAERFRIATLSEAERKDFDLELQLWRDRQSYAVTQWWYNEGYPKVLREELRQELTKELTEQIEKETAERVEKETAERVEKETAERVEKETAERVEKETAIQTALKAIDLGLDNNAIAALTKLSIAEIEDLRFKK